MTTFGRRALLVLALLGATSAWAAVNDCSGPLFPIPGSFEELDVSSTALPFTVAKYAPTGGDPGILAQCTVEDDAVRVRTDGLAPTATVGDLWPVGSKFYVCGLQNLKNFRVIRVTGDADLSCTYYRTGDN